MNQKKDMLAFMVVTVMNATTNVNAVPQHEIDELAAELKTANHFTLQRLGIVPMGRSVDACINDTLVLLKRFVMIKLATRVQVPLATNDDVTPGH